MADRTLLYLGELGRSTQVPDTDRVLIGTGGVLSSGDITMSSAEVLGLPAVPSGDTAAVSKAYADTKINPAEHEALRQLIHYVDDGPATSLSIGVFGAYRETNGPGIRPLGYTWWETPAKAKRILTLSLTWTGNVVTQEQWRMYDTDGVTVLATLTDVISYAGLFEVNRVRTVA